MYDEDEAVDDDEKRMGRLFGWSAPVAVGRAGRASHCLTGQSICVQLGRTQLGDGVERIAGHLVLKNSGVPCVCRAFCACGLGRGRCIDTFDPMLAGSAKITISTTIASDTQQQAFAVPWDSGKRVPGVIAWRCITNPRL